MNLSSIYPRPVQNLAPPTLLAQAGAMQSVQPHWVCRPSRETHEHMQSVKSPIDTMQEALKRQSYMPESTRKQLLDQVGLNIKRLKEGKGKREDWNQVFSLVRAAMAIEQQGIVRGQKTEIIAAWDAMLALQVRYYGKNGWQSRIGFTPEQAEAIDELVVRHEVQLQFLTMGEFKAAIRVALSWSTDALNRVMWKWKEAAHDNPV